MNSAAPPLLSDVRNREVVKLQSVGKDVVIARFRTIRSVNFHTYESGRLKISEGGDSLFAVLPTGVYLFPVKPTPASNLGTKPKVKIKTIDP